MNFRGALKPALVLPPCQNALQRMGSFGGRGNKARLSISFPGESHAQETSDTFLQAVFLKMFGSWDHTLYPFEELAPERGSFVNGPFGGNLLTSELRSSGVL